MQGIVTRIFGDALIAIVGRDRIYIHSDDCEGFDPRDCHAGERVEIGALVSDAKGARGTSVRLSGQSAAPRVTATVTTLDQERCFGFVAVEGYGDAFFHASSFADHTRRDVSPTFLHLERGDRLRGILVEVAQGHRLEAIKVD